MAYEVIKVLCEFIARGESYGLLSNYYIKGNNKMYTKYNYGKCYFRFCFTCFSYLQAVSRNV